ncbi:SCO family protein [Maribacter hydrothermalis]|uniref:Photosynthetic protein synthase II n=1 Tax=Maribacter hydrothermalis TaxID=1836467 RepID=A0A1B7ZFJ8_9FLAO|nr:SCO family protein [Maribacter hydrothermalis]APQ17848.1 SCO family protein [Maribacter hydrothermalis]OBR42321.1 photosynthetic protein synthase II [Maribacter hydrothermalis]
MNKRYTYIWVSLIVLIFGILVIPSIVDRVSRDTIVDKDRHNVGNKTGELGYILLDGKKRKVPSFEFINQDSILISDKDYLGKVYVVDFFFTRCPSICPVMTTNLVDIQKKFKNNKDFGIASFSITPDFDTPQVLREYVKKYKIQGSNWNLFTGDKEGVYDLANAGFNIFAAEMPEVPGGFEHSGLFALVDKEGYLRSRKDEFGNPIVYYRGAILEKDGENDHGETEEIGILKADIQKLLKE